MTPYERMIKGPVDIETKPESDSVAAQAKLNWLMSDVTQRIIKDIMNDSNDLVTDAMSLALINHQQDNSKQIVHKLIEAQTLRKVVEKYATAK